MNFALRALWIVVLAAACRTTETEPPESSEHDNAIEDESLPEPGPIEEAATLMARGEPEKALSVVDAALLESPEDHELHYARGVALQRLARPDEAVASWRSALERKSGFFPALNGIGAVELDRANYDAAIEALRGAIEAKPDFPDAHYNLGLALMNKGDLEASLVAFLRAKELNPGDADVHEMLATLQLKRGDHAAARVAADAVRELRKDDASALRIDAKVLSAEGKHSEAAAAYGAIVAATPEDAESRLLLARELVRSDRAEEALPHLSRLAADLPQEAVVWSDWGAALVNLGRIEGPKGALARLDTALRLKPGLVSARLRRVAALSAIGRCRSAVAAHRELLGSKPAAKEQAEKALGKCAKRRK
ncbi:MAG TPA: tetratricopeptide repeat protein [Nannocystis exedens]|nr:tetratricopeptide repeat protein [Nannocystis exedens]